MRSFNIKDTYVDKDDTWSGISEAVELSIISTEIRLKGYILFQLVFGPAVILLIKHKV